MADTSGRALYLQWRPRTFGDVVGQRHVVQTLRNAVKNGTLAHAYLFAGPRGTGKTSMARLLFKAANCLQPEDGGPDERCAICVAANAGRAIDLIEMDAASNRGIDDVRELRDKINYSPSEARYRVYILDEAHQLTQPAWDALLKTLEEPPPHAILVLATTEAHKVPATVLSRCQRFDFHRHSAADIRDRLAEIAADEGIVVEPTVLSWLARAARGGMRDAISLLDQLRAFAGDRIDADSAREVLGLAGLETVRPFLEALRDDRAADALELLNGAVERGSDLRVFAADVLSYLRALLLLRYGAAASLRADFPLEEVEWLEGDATGWEAARLRGLVGGFGDALTRFRDPAQLLIQLELVLLGGWDPPEAGVSRRPAQPASASGELPRDGVATAPTRPSPAPPPSSEVVQHRVAAAPAAGEPVDPRGSEARPDGGGAGPLPVGEEAGGVSPTAVPVAQVEVRPRENGALENDGSENGGSENGGSAPADAGLAAPEADPSALNGHPPLDADEVGRSWPRVKAAVGGSSVARAWFHNCELARVEQNTLVLRLDGGARALLRDRQVRLAIERELSESLGRPVAVALEDESEAVPPAGDLSPSDRPAADDPVVRTGVKLFGGPAQRVDDAE